MSGGSIVSGPGTPRACVVIPAFRRPELVRLAVASALQQDLPSDAYEVLVVDSSPDDAVERAVRALQSDARCALRYERKPPEGPGPSRNLGARLGRGAFIAFLDSDCVATPSWLREGLATFEDGLGIVQGRTLPDPNGRPGVFTWYLEVQSESFVFEAANLFYRREAFEAAGGFWADLQPNSVKPMGGEDVDLGWRVKRLGWQTRFAPDAVVHHEVVPISPWKWLYTKQFFIWPLLVGRFPELRPYLYARYFYDRAQAALVLALVGALLAYVTTPFALLACIPYLALRFSEPTNTLSGLRRPLRVAAYLLKDLTTLALLLAGSVRYRSLLL